MLAKDVPPHVMDPYKISFGLVDSFRRSDIFDEIAEHSLSIWLVKDRLSPI